MTAPVPDPSIEEIWARLETEVGLDDAWDSESRCSPYDPAGVRRELVALGERAARGLVLHLDDPRESMRLQALYAFQELGALASLAVPALLDRVRRSSDLEHAVAVRALCAVDLEAAIASGLQVAEGTRAPMLAWVFANEPLEGQRRYVERLLEAGPESQRFAMLGEEHGVRGLFEHPEVAPIARIEALLESEDGSVARAAARVLLYGRIQGHERRFLELLRSPGSKIDLIEIESIAPLGESGGLLEPLVTERSFVLLIALARRRRQAGLATPLEPLRALLAEALGKRYRGSEREVGSAIELAAELAERVELAPIIAAASRDHALHYSPFITDALHRYQVAVGDAAGIWTLDDADQRFCDGRISESIRATAGDAYDEVLLTDASNAHAAFQLAWIARVFGTPIEERRVHWIRSLGFADDELLGELRRPTARLNGRWGDWAAWPPDHAPEDRYLERIARMESAELWSVAARELQSLEKTLAHKSRSSVPESARRAIPARIRELGVRRAACESRARAHVERVRAACAPPVG
jgi:hypothetical protein